MFQYGFSDGVRGYTFEIWRWLWIEAGSLYSGGVPPDGYDAAAQLTKIGLDLDYYRLHQSNGGAVVETIQSVFPRFRGGLLRDHVRVALHYLNPRAIPNELREKYREMTIQLERLVEGNAETSTIESLLKQIQEHIGFVCSPGDLHDSAVHLHCLGVTDVPRLFEMKQRGTRRPWAVRER